MTAQNAPVQTKEGKTIELVSSKTSLEEKLQKITELGKTKVYYAKIQEREDSLNDLDFSEGNRNQCLTIIDSQGFKFEVVAAPVINEVVDILKAKLNEEKKRVEAVLINATM